MNRLMSMSLCALLCVGSNVYAAEKKVFRTDRVSVQLSVTKVKVAQGQKISRSDRIKFYKPVNAAQQSYKRIQRNDRVVILKQI